MHCINGNIAPHSSYLYMIPVTRLQYCLYYRTLSMPVVLDAKAPASIPVILEYNHL
jgi:hypothetical protein